MARAFWLCCLGVVIFMAMSSFQFTFAGEEKILDATINRYMTEAAKWEPTIKQAAKRIFFILAIISMIFTFGYMLIKGNASIGEFFGEFMRFGITTGFFYWLLNNGGAIANDIIKGFGELGISASSTYEKELSPTNITWFGLELIVRSVKTFGEQDIATSVIALLLSIAVAVLFAIIAAQMVLLLCSAWVLVYAGIIFLGFGGGKWTSDMAINYFKTVLGLAVQTFVFCLLVGIGQQQVERLILDSAKMKTVEVAGLLYGTNQVQTTAMTVTEGCVILVFTTVLFMLVKSVPQLVASIVSGSQTGGISLGGSGAVIAGAAAVASGGAAIAAQAAGGYMAISTAYNQASNNMAKGEGAFAGAGDLTKPQAGLAKAMDTGSRFLSDMASSLGGGIKDTAKEAIQGGGGQGGTLGGKVAAHMEATQAASDAKRAASVANGKPDNPADAGFNAYAAAQTAAFFPGSGSDSGDGGGSGGSISGSGGGSGGDPSGGGGSVGASLNGSGPVVPPIDNFGEEPWDASKAGLADES